MTEPEQDIYGPQHDADSPSEEWLAGYQVGAEARRDLEQRLAAKVRALSGYKIDPTDAGTIEAYGAVELFRAAVLALLAPHDATATPGEET